jgi:hypothetical protein
VRPISSSSAASSAGVARRAASAAAGEDHDQALPGQAAQRLPHRRQPDADRLGQRLLVEHRGRRQLERHDPLAQVTVRLRVLGVGIGGGVGREHRGGKLHGEELKLQLGR